VNVGWDNGLKVITIDALPEQSEFTAGCQLPAAS
jgi:hypothetical protein